MTAPFTRRVICANEPRCPRVLPSVVAVLVAAGSPVQRAARPASFRYPALRVDRPRDQGQRPEGRSPKGKASDRSSDDRDPRQRHRRDGGTARHPRRVHPRQAGRRRPTGRAYPEAIAKIAEQFEAQLRVADTNGMMILDARTMFKNVPSVQTITTRPFRPGGDNLRHLAESPVFGHSDTHVLLQVADRIASAGLFPMTCAAYCDDVLGNAHPHPSYDQLQTRSGERLRRLEHWYVDDDGRRRGGVIVFDTRKRDRRSTSSGSHLTTDHSPNSRADHS